MVISIDSVLIKQLGELLNVILAISIITWQDERRFEFYFADNVILTHIATSPFLKLEVSHVELCTRRKIILAVQVLEVEFLC